MLVDWTPAIKNTFPVFELMVPSVSADSERQIIVTTIRRFADCFCGQLPIRVRRSRTEASIGSEPSFSLLCVCG